MLALVLDVAGQTDNGACGDLVCETEALNAQTLFCVVVLVHVLSGAHRSDLQAPARSLRAGPAISVLCFALCSRSQALHLPSRDPP